MAGNNEIKWLYSIYRNSDDKLLALDVPIHEAARITGMQKGSIYCLFAKHGGINRVWTITKKSIAEVEKETNE